jgi:hypothetical protein
MFIAIAIVGSLVGLIVVMALVGFALPRDHMAARTTALAKPPADVWRALVELGQDPLFEVVEDRPHERRITRVADDSLPYGGRWIYELAPDNGGTRLTITEDGFIKNPIFRFLSATVFSTASTIEKFMRDLGTHLGTPAVIEKAKPSSVPR